MSVAARSTATALGLALAGAAAIGSAAADPPPKVYKACPRDKVWSETANGCVCAEGRAWDDKTKSCAAIDPPRCPQGKTRTDAGVCVETKKTPVDAGALPDGGCGPNREWKDAFGGCVPACGRGEVLDFYGRACHPIKVR